MNTQNTSKINRLLQNWPKGIVATDRFLRNLGINKDLKHSYIKSNWIKSIGYGAAVRIGDVVDWKGGVYALQNQLNLSVHIAGKTALDSRGYSHFVQFKNTRVILFIKKGINIPKWFLNYDWQIEFEITSSNFLPENIGIEEQEIEGIKLNISSPERAIMELLYFVPDKQSIEEASLIMENLISLRPIIVQNLLEQCKSIKVKRTFLYLAERLNHPWFKRLDLSKINLGLGKRHLIDNGFFDSKYKITVPLSLKNEE